MKSLAILILSVFIIGCATVADIRNIHPEQGVSKYYDAPPEDVLKAVQTTLPYFKNTRILETTPIRPGVWVIISEIPWTFYGGGPEYIRVTLESHTTGTIVRVLSKWKPFTFAPNSDYSQIIFYDINYRLHDLKRPKSSLIKQENEYAKKDIITPVSEEHDFKKSKLPEMEKSKVDLLQQELIKNNPKSFVEKPYVGVYVIKNIRNEFEIASVTQKSPAGGAGIQTGDIIESVDNLRFKDRMSLFEYFFERKKPGEIIDVVLRRGGKTISMSVKPESKHFLYDQYVLSKEMTNEKPINLAVIIGDITNAYLQDKALSDQWRVGMKSILISNWENIYLQTLRYEKNFSLVDRNKTEQILKEFAFQQTGLVKEESQVKLGMMLGATHFFIIDFSRFYLSPTKATDMETHKLIELVSGRTLASVILKTEAKIQMESSTPFQVQQELLDFYNVLLPNILSLERDAIEALSRVTGNNYKNDSLLQNALINIVIPKYSEFMQKLKNISLTQDEIRNLHKIYVEGGSLQLESFITLKEGIEKQDVKLVSEANEKLQKGKEKIQEWQEGLNTILKKYHINIAK